MSLFPHKPPATAHHHRLAPHPEWFTRWLGYRTTAPATPPNYVIWFWSFVGAFGSVAVIQAVFSQAHYFVERGVPSIVASYGASAVLVYGAVDAPFSQPRSLYGGHFIGALTGVCITKLFHLLPTEERFLQLEWLAGSLSTALAVVFMQMTETTHPPAGATALLAAVNTDIRDIGWYYIAVVLLTSTLACAVGLLTNNIQRRYPVFWFKPIIPPHLRAPELPPLANNTADDELPTALNSTTNSSAIGINNENEKLSGKSSPV